MEIKFELIQIEKNYQTTRSLFVKDRTLFIIGRSEKLGKKIFFVNDFFPRFFVEEDENIDLIVKENSEKIKDIKLNKDGEEYNYKNLGGKKNLVTLITHTTQNVVDIRDLFSKTYEANIKFTEVFKREKLIKGYFYVPDYIFKTKNRFYNINGIEYIMLYEKEINGGELEF